MLAALWPVVLIPASVTLTAGTTGVAATQAAVITVATS